MQSGLLGRLLLWRAKHVTERQFVLFLSFVVGVLGGLAAVILKNTVHYTDQFLNGRLRIDSINIEYFFYPMLGILLTVIFVRYLVKDDIGHGVSRILYAISRKQSKLRAHNTYSSMLASTLTVGFGGSVGLEAPIVLTGSSIGSNIGHWMRLNYKNTTLLIGCGAAAAIAGIFKAPIAAVIFALEVLMLDLTMWSIIPLLIASVTGATLAAFLLGKGVIFYFTLQEPFILGNLPWYILLGIVTGLISVYFNRGAMFIEGKFSQIKSPYQRLLLGGGILGFLIFLFPPLYGEGYEALKAILTGEPDQLAYRSILYGYADNYWILLAYLLLILVFKVVAMSVTTGSGGVGGIFAPTLFMGGIAGFVVAKTINSFNFINVSEQNFALVGMAGMMAGVMHAPLTAIFLIAEITGGYGLFIPLILTATFSFITINLFEPHSLYTARLAAKGDLITHHKDNAILTLMKLNKVIEKDFKKVKPDQTLGELVKVVSASKRNMFPVVSEEGDLKGIVLLDNIRDIMFDSTLYHTTLVQDLMTQPPAIVSTKDSMTKVMRVFEDTDAWNLPVMEEGKYLGFISKSKIFSAYRKLLIEFSDE
jgi:chloride channel protein, CIC family